MALTPEMALAARDLAGAGTESERLGRLRQALLDGKTFSFEYAKYSTFTSTEGVRGPPRKLRLLPRTSSSRSGVRSAAACRRRSSRRAVRPSFRAISS